MKICSYIKNSFITQAFSLIAIYQQEYSGKKGVIAKQKKVE